jgi:hypothetical protein
MTLIIEEAGDMYSYEKNLKFGFPGPGHPELKRIQNMELRSTRGKCLLLCADGVRQYARQSSG